MMDSEDQLQTFIDKFRPDVAALTRQLLDKMKARVPGATILVYDNYNALAIGFGPSEKASQAVFSLAVMPRLVLLYFINGARLQDPDGLLRGEGRQGRHIRMTSVDMLDDPKVDDLIARALADAEPPIDPGQPHRLIIKSVSAKQRPRRPKD